MEAFAAVTARALTVFLDLSLRVSITANDIFLRMPAYASSRRRLPRFEEGAHVHLVHRARLHRPRGTVDAGELVAPPPPRRVHPHLQVAARPSAKACRTPPEFGTQGQSAGVAWPAPVLHRAFDERQALRLDAVARCARAALGRCIAAADFGSASVDGGTAGFGDRAGGTGGDGGGCGGGGDW